ncbi:unnamed protein product [Thelazia callipaeda]|uniref:DnaJ homolog subfamily C member 21 n=1 Tax=Thelazia callipaeda TaxID=103827 RepID=A0A0N5CNH8_THECL|nr:unnamed protein product [Thelazia callipaeda]
MRCYYDVLEVERTANDEMIRRSYRKLALKWHPDKNPSNVEECTRYFSLIQQAYDVLSNKKERVWYDRHRESILKGAGVENFETNTLNLFPYFTSSCYSEYGTDDKSFYVVYKKLFEALASEEYEFLDRKIVYPNFGDHQSSYEDVVQPFYAFWSCFHTVRSYTWIDKFDIRNAPNRRCARAMENENKKLREASKRKRNEEIQALVAFVRRRDPRVHAHIEILKTKQTEAQRKAEEKRKQGILEQLSKADEYKELQEVQELYLEHLCEIEEMLDADFGYNSDDNVVEGDKSSNFYCTFCEKTFKSLEAFRNHEQSKKHKNIVLLLKKHVQECDLNLLISQESDHVDVKERDFQSACSSEKRCYGKKEKKLENPCYDLCNDECDNNLNETNIFMISNKNLRTSQFIKESGRTNEKNGMTNIKPKVDSCDRCGEFFESRAKLFAHLKQSGHTT